MKTRLRKKRKNVNSTTRWSDAHSGSNLQITWDAPRQKEKYNDSFHLLEKESHSNTRT